MAPRKLFLVVFALVFAFAGAPGLRAQDPALQAAGQKIQAGDFAGAAQALEALTQAQPQNAVAWQLLGYAYHAAGSLEKALPAHRRAAGFPHTAAVGSYNAACAYALLGKQEEAFEWLGKAQGAGFQNVALLRSDPDLNSLRSDPRFSSFLPAPGQAWSEPDAIALHTLTGEAAGDQFGWEADDVGDVDGDGVHDICSTAPTHGSGSNAGKIYVHSGASGKLLFTLSGQPGDQLGFSTARAGDVDGDGHADLLVGAPYRGPGRVHLVSGKDGAILRTFVGEQNGDSFGQEVCALSDLDGDGRPELAVSATRHDGAGLDAGRVSVFSSATGNRLHVLDGERAGDRFGSSLAGCTTGGHALLAIGAQNAGDGQRGGVRVVRLGEEIVEHFRVASGPQDQNLGQYFLSFVGDVDADGVLDLYSSDFSSNVGAPGSGRVYLHSGSDGRLLFELRGRAGEGFGIGSAECGDVDGDGHDDLVIGAWQNAEGGASAGKVYLYSGKDQRLLRTWTGTLPGDTFGFDAKGLGDVNGDGATDFLLTSAWNGAAGYRAGRVYVLSGESRAVPASSPAPQIEDEAGGAAEGR